MKFNTQYNVYGVQRKSKENTGTASPVVQTKVRGNSEVLAQMMLAGQYVEAARIGYDFAPGDKLPEEIRVRPGRGADVVEVLEYVERLGKHIRQAYAEAAKRSEEERLERQNTGVFKEAGEVGKNAGSSDKDGAGTTATGTLGAGVPKNAAS